MTDYIREEIINGKDECLNKVLQCLEEKSSCYYKKLCEVFGSTEYFDQFKKCYENVQSPGVNDQALSPLHEHLCAILEWRSLLATEVEALQVMKAEIEDYPKDFEIQIRLSESLHEQNRLRRELDTLKEQAERLRMENNAYSTVIDEVKKDYNEKLAEANERAKKAEKAFIDLTRHRSTHSAMGSTTSINKAPDAALQKRTSETMISAMSPYPFNSSLEKVQTSSMRFKVYSTLTAWEGFDSLDENSSDDDVAIGNKAASEDTVEPTMPKSAKLETSLTTEVRPSTPEGVVTKLPDLDASPIMSTKPVGSNEVTDDAEGDARASLSSTPRKSLPSPMSKSVTPRQNEVSTPEPSASVAAVTSPSSAPSPSVFASYPIKAPNCAPQVPANSSGVEVVDKAVYLQLYNEVLELRSELEKVNNRRELSTNATLSNAVAPGNELGLTTQLNDLHNQVCHSSVQETSFASPARVSDGDIFPINPIPLRENKHFTDWSISLDQTNISCAAMDTSENDVDGVENAAKNPRASMSVGQQTDISYLGSDCSSDSVNTQSGLVPLPEMNASALGVNMPSPASTLQELNVDFSESVTRQGPIPEIVESACSPILDLTTKGIDASSECHLLGSESFPEYDRELSESLNSAAGVCIDLLRCLSAVQPGTPLKSNCDIKDELNSGVVNLKPILQKLGTEVERLSRSYVELEKKQASQPSYEAEVIKLREKLEEAERLLEARSPFDSHISAMRINEVLEAEREQLQRELNQRLADCGTTHATSVAELEQVQADLSARLGASEVRANNLEAERNAIAQKFSATERFLNEQLQEREQEREEFQTEVSCLREEISTLRSKLTTLERQRSQDSASNPSSLVPTPQASPRKPQKSRSHRSGVQTLATSTPVSASSRSLKRTRTLTPSLLSLPDSDHSDVDDSPSFELAVTPHGMESQMNNQQRDWSRPLSAGDAVLRQQVRPPMKLITTSVGGSPVELVDASISAQTSLSDHSSGSSTEIDGDLVDEEVDDVQTITTTAAAMGLITTVTTTKRKRHNGRHNRASSHMVTSPEVPPNNLGLDVEMKHVAEMQELREALKMAQNSLAEKDMELEDLRAQLEPARMLPGESVEVQTLTNTPPDPGACWSCKAQLLPPNSAAATIVTVVAAAVSSPQTHPPLTHTQGSRDSTLSPPPISDRNSGSSSNAEASFSTPASGASSQAGEVEDQIVDVDDEEEEMYQQVEHVSSSESDHLAADLEEARAEIVSLKAEINGLINYQDDLHRDFELVQSMLEERQSEVERLQKELLDVPIRLQADFDASVRKLQKRMTDKCEVVEERDEDLYVLNEEKEALAIRVKELENELASFRENTGSREDMASQTGPPHYTVESGIQVDLERSFSPSIKADQSRADTDCVGEDDLPFDSDFITSSAHPDNQPSVPLLTTEETLAAVDQLQQESCRLLSLSLTAASSADPNDYKSQLISKLIEANRMLKSVIENVTKEEPLVTEELTQSAPKNKSLSNPLYHSLLSALLADRRANLSLLTANTIDQTSNAVMSRSSKSGSINDVMKALAGYATMEEERWKEVSSALASDRKSLLADVDSMKKRENLLLEEVAHLTNQLSARDTTLAQKSAAVDALACETKALEGTISELKKLLNDAKKDKENIIEKTRSQIEEERQRATELESKLEASQTALQQTRERVGSLENDLQKSSADVILEQNRSRLAETRIAQLEQEVKAMKLSFVRIEPKAGINMGTLDARKNYPSAINHISNQLASVRLQAIKAEKMSRDLHECNQNLRVSLAEAELALLPLSLGKENRLYLVNGSGSGSGSTSGDDESGPYSVADAIPASRTLPKQLTDSGFADAPAGLRRLHFSCMRLLRLVSLATGGVPGDAGSSSSSSDSLNNPAELLRYAVLGGKKTDYTEQHLGPAEVYTCLDEVESHVRALVGGPFVDGAHAKSNAAANALFMQAKQLILNGAAQLSTSMAQPAASVDRPDSVGQVSTECKSTQCSLVANHQSSGDSRTVSLEKFRHMSARYLRMESYRRALVYQKQYLLLLLGDFQHSVQKVTASLGQGLLMGTSSRQDSDGNLLPGPPHWPLDSPPPLVRFRAAARCIMVIHRVKQLRLKWQRTGIRSHAPVHLTSESRTPNPVQSNTTTTSTSSTIVPTPPIPIGSGIVGASQLHRLSSPSLASRPRYFGDRNSHPLSPATGFLDSGLDAIHRRNNSTSSITQLSRPSFPRMDAQHHQMEVSSSFRHQQERQAHPQLHRVPTSSPSVVNSSSSIGGGGSSLLSRFRWGSFRG